jgi:hypothetical protein
MYIRESTFVIHIGLTGLNTQLNEISELNIFFTTCIVYCIDAQLFYLPIIMI